MATRILIVEDDLDITALVARYLDKAGFVTERVASGREALSDRGSSARAAGARPDAALSSTVSKSAGSCAPTGDRRHSDHHALRESERIVGQTGRGRLPGEAIQPERAVARVRALLRRAQRATAADQGRSPTD
jgi:hypothetical protein